jgi:hypothetical protein
MSPDGSFLESAEARECDLDVGLSAGFEIVQGFVGKILGMQTG